MTKIRRNKCLATRNYRKWNSYLPPWMFFKNLFLTCPEQRTRFIRAAMLKIHLSFGVWVGISPYVVNRMFLRLLPEGKIALSEEKIYKEEKPSIHFLDDEDELKHPLKCCSLKKVHWMSNNHKQCSWKRIC